MSTVAVERNLIQTRRPRLKAFKRPTLTPQLLHAVAVAAKKRAAGCRDKLKPGAYEVAECVYVVGTLTVGHDTETAATVTPDANELLALVLSKLTVTMRSRILRELPADFARNGNVMPAVDEKLVDQATALCQSLRRKVVQKRRGAVSGDLAIHPVGNLEDPRY